MSSIAVKTNHVDRRRGQPAENCAPRSLVQPRFFADQILNDADLNALVAWTRDKLQLHRYREGWGVVCGLRVGFDAGGQRLVVAPGYAIDSCGRDIIVCTDECHRAEIVVRDLVAGLEADCAPPGGSFQLDCYQNNLMYIRVVDVYLHYQETDEGSRPTRGCAPVRCEKSRTREGYEIIPREGRVGEDPLENRISDWRYNVKQYFKQLFDDRIRPFLGETPTPARVAALNTALQAASAGAGAAFPLALLPAPEDGKEYERLISCAFWVALDCLMAAIGHACAACDPTAGVPLARVWLQTHNAAGRRDRRVLLVDNAPPFRRLLHADPYPAPLGGHNLAPYYWRHIEDVYGALRDTGLTNVQVNKNWAFPGDLRGLSEWADSQIDFLCLRDGDLPLVLQAWDVGPLGNRIVGFEPASAV